MSRRIKCGFCGAPLTSNINFGTQYCEYCGNGSSKLNIPLFKYNIKKNSKLKVYFNLIKNRLDLYKIQYFRAYKKFKYLTFITSNNVKKIFFNNISKKIIKIYLPIGTITIILISTVNNVILKPSLNKYFYKQGLEKRKENELEALKYLKNAIYFDDKDYNSYYLIGIIYYNLKDYNQAIKNLERGVEINPDDHKMLYKLALAKAYNNYFNSALRDLNSLIKKEPNHIKALRLRGSIKEQYSNKIEACKDWEKALKLGDQLSKNFFTVNCQ